MCPESLTAQEVSLFVHEASGTHLLSLLPPVRFSPVHNPWPRKDLKHYMEIRNTTSIT